uniref:zinc-binding metallopeptidase family protein n=1 Tax=Ningiella ruwaisensis TaxID=2364274 RepID=UPI0010A07F6C|nr:putative zinc-binding metallopeptidase [Ningiella ruwaisensis]
MKTFTCSCGNTLHFPNTQCVKCGASVGFLPDKLVVADIQPSHDNTYTSVQSEHSYRKCRNYAIEDVCNWMVRSDDDNPLCTSCRLTHTIPNLDKAENRKLWFYMEEAKRRLLYSLLKLDLPIVSKWEDPKKGLGFAFLEDVTEDEFGNELTLKEYVSTGHSGGLITINLKEADPSNRIKIREQMQEQYRTLLGHFRHESGHYFWDQLVKDSDQLDEFRALFGDERIDYQHAMQSYYANGPNPNWQNVWISAYASMHPWEDWAETWAHYLHMVDTLQTANHFSFSIGGAALSDPLHEHPHDDALITERNFTRLFNDWCKLTSSLNALNRSMGLDDAYPFIISISALNKLRFVHNIIEQSAQSKVLEKGTENS